MPDEACEREAFLGLLKALLPRLWRFGIVLTRDRQQTGDLVQAACLRGIENRHQFSA